MYARIIRAHVPPENFDQALTAARDYNLPMVVQMPGFRSGYWTGDRQTGTITTFVVFDSQDGIRAAEAGMERMRPLVAPLNVQFDSVENLEVFAAQGARLGIGLWGGHRTRRRHRAERIRALGLFKGFPPAYSPCEQDIDHSAVP